MADWDRSTPWRQGRLLGPEAVRSLGLACPIAPEQTLVAVASHDCDLAQEPGTEPMVEVVVGHAIDEKKVDGNLLHSKNPRRLHLEYGGTPALWAEFEATGKTAVQKAALEGHAPRTDVRLEPRSLVTFQMWLASRYRRSAFPDEFDRRLTQETNLAERISKVVKPHGDQILGVFFDVDDGEDIDRSGPDDPYVLDILVLHAAEPEPLAAGRAAANAAAEIKRAFRERLLLPTGQWRQIELHACEAVSEAVLSYQQFRALKRWRLDHVSLGADPQQPPVAE